MSLKALAKAILARQSSQSCIVALPSTCNRATLGGGSATSDATTVQPLPPAARYGVDSGATSDATTTQPDSKNRATFDATLGGKSCVKLHQPSASLAGDVMGELVGLPLLHEDRIFVQACLYRLFASEPVQRAVLRGYRRHWEQGAAAMPTEHRKDNAGRYAANSWIRELTAAEAKQL